MRRHPSKRANIKRPDFTKWTEAVPLPVQEARINTKAFVDTFVIRFGTSLQEHADQGRNFEVKIFQEMCTYLQTEKTRTTSLKLMVLSSASAGL